MKNLLVFLIVASFLSCEKSQYEEQVYTGEALGTTYQLKFFSEEEINAEQGLDSIFEVINSSMSTYQENSDISRLNKRDTVVEVDDHFVEVFQYSKKIYEESEGYFDPTVGKLVNAFGFGPEKSLSEMNRANVDSLLQYVGFDKLHLEDNKVYKENPGVYLDFNAIAKGYAVDVIGEYLEEHGVENYLIEVGGELLAGGENKSREQPWLVGIDDPQQTEGNRVFQETLMLKDRALATSGNYRKFRTDSVTGQAYVHTINPLTGQAEKSDLLSASVLAKNCTLADGYATAFMALGLEKSIEMLGTLQDVDVYFIYADDENEEIAVYTSSGFDEVLK